MDYKWIWETALIFMIGKAILRVGGRKSISQMTITQAIVMVGLGSLIIQPLAQYDIFTILAAAFLLVVLMIIFEFLETKVDALETIFSGKAVIVIEDGKLLINNLKKLRLSVDRLETRLRQNGVSSIEDIKIATIEVSGQLGYELKDGKRPLTKEDFIIIMSEITELKKIMAGNQITQERRDSDTNIFDEVKRRDKEGKKEP